MALSPVWNLVEKFQIRHHHDDEHHPEDEASEGRIHPSPPNFRDRKISTLAVPPVTRKSSAGACPTNPDDTAPAVGDERYRPPRAARNLAIDEEILQLLLPPAQTQRPEDVPRPPAPDRQRRGQPRRRDGHQRTAGAQRRRRRHRRLGRDRESRLRHRHLAGHVEPILEPAARRRPRGPPGSGRPQHDLRAPALRPTAREVSLARGQVPLRSRPHRQVEQPLHVVESHASAPGGPLERRSRDAARHRERLRTERGDVHGNRALLVRDDGGGALVRDGVDPVGVGPRDRRSPRERRDDGRRELPLQQRQQPMAHPVADHAQVAVRLVFPGTPGRKPPGAREARAARPPAADARCAPRAAECRQDRPDPRRGSAAAARSRPDRPRVARRHPVRRSSPATRSKIAYRARCPACSIDRPSARARPATSTRSTRIGTSSAAARPRQKPSSASEAPPRSWWLTWSSPARVKPPAAAASARSALSGHRVRATRQGPPARGRPAESARPSRCARRTRAASGRRPSA